MLGKLILGLSGVVFTAYGVFSFIFPETTAGFAGLVLSNGDALAEVSSMYGGLQTGFGLFCLLACLKREYFHSGLVLLVLAVGSLAAARLFSSLIGDAPVTTYTYGAIVYELFTAGIAAVALWNNTSSSSNMALSK